MSKAKILIVDDEAGVRASLAGVRTAPGLLGLALAGAALWVGLSRAGLPLEEALLAVSQQTEKPRVRNIVAGVRARVMEGRSLADALGDEEAVGGA